MLDLALSSNLNCKGSEVWLAQKAPAWCSLTECPSVELIGDSFFEVPRQPTGENA